MTVYVAIFQDEEKRVVIEFQPLLNSPEFERFFDGIEIASMDIQYRPRSPWEVRQQERREHGQRKRGIVLSAEEEHAEAMMPTARREQVQLKMPEF
ncbi:MAG: hypothetical protein HXY42_03735 [Chloroflexi bacterium]|nr:hypothetical protein [Chloroflexota bacterium]